MNSNEQQESDKLICKMVASAATSVIRYSMGHTNHFHEQCCRVLQVTNSKDAESELYKRLCDIAAGRRPVITSSICHNEQQLNNAPLQSETSELDIITPKSSSSDNLINQACADIEEWL
ncbi:hypothetical protein C0J52_09213 [Blattella germanica]|nr:hypothetical protein C0J52_09213 [Blattella germanica]